MPHDVILSTYELSILIGRSDREHVLPLRYGVGGIVLNLNEAKWAIPIIAELRGVTNTAG